MGGCIHAQVSNECLDDANIAGPGILLIEVLVMLQSHNIISKRKQVK